ncbi:MAG TPA: porin [Pseudolabrys sp.]|nr:porin [Pseudolabrys sp.]
MRAHAHDAIGVIAPPKRQSLQYVKICSLYGAGFYYIPGTDTCLKLGGWVRAEMNFNALGSFNPYHIAIGTGALDGRGLNFENTRVRGIITVDARTQTEYGTLRSYIAGGWQLTNGDWPANGTYAPRAFVQWAGFTAGRAQSFFDIYITPAYSNTTNVLGSDTGGQGDTVFAYTAQFGNGFSATISAEDQTTRTTPNTVTIAGTGITGSPYYNDLAAGRQWPDIVGNLRVDQAWGSAQIMGAAHQVRNLGLLPVTGNEVGWAAGIGATLNLPMIGPGDTVSAQFAWAKGALNYVGNGLSNFAIQNGNTIGWGPTYDAVVTPTGLELTTGWSVVAGYQHIWSPNWRTSLYGGYGKITYDDFASFLVSGSVRGTADWAFWQVGSRTVWNPVPNLDLSVDVLYNHIDTAWGPLLPFADDKGWWQGIFRVQRNFYP